MKIKKIFKNLDKNFSSINFNNLQFNSRKCKKYDIFFAIKGLKQNGNNYIKDAIARGAKTIISNQKFEGFKDGVLFLHSENPRKLLSDCASKIYSKKPRNLIAVTGTNGKSSIANFFFQILKLNNIKVASIGTLGVNTTIKNIKTENTTLDPLTVNKILNQLKLKKIENVILEASSHGLKQNRLDGIKFNVGIFTNLSRDHLDYHKTFNDYFNSKLILFNKLMKKNSKIIYDEEINESKKLKKISDKNNLKKITIGKKKSKLKILENKILKNYQIVKFNYKNKNYFFKTKLIGKIQIKNLIMAILACNESNLAINKIIKVIEKIKPVQGRLEKIGNLFDKSIVILDFAHTPEALKSCLLSVREHFKFSKISIVFGCGGERDRPKRKIMGKIANDYCDKIYLTDDNPRKENPKKIRSQIKVNIEKKKLIEISSRKKAISKSIKDLDPGDVLLVAGKGHENYQEYFKKKKFSDKKCILEEIRKKNKSLSKDWKLNIIKKKIKKINFKKISKINNISINSKKIKKNDMFFAVKGKKFDGNRFANEAIKKGAALSIVDKNINKDLKNKYKVENSLKVLTEYSKLIRKISNLNVIAITGSSGKTSLKDLMGQTLNKISSTNYSKNSFNNKFGVPLSLSNIKINNHHGVYEIGMNKFGEINKLSKLVMPDVGVITNISYAHIKNFKNLNQIALAKSEIINNINKKGTLVLNKDDKYYDLFKKKALLKNLKVISFSTKKIADIKLSNLVKKKSEYIIYIKIYNKLKKFIIKKKLKPYIKNILATIAVISINYDVEILNKKIFYDFTIPKGRGNIFKVKINNKIINIIDESYNSNPLSLEFAISKINEMKMNPKNKKILLGDMLELGSYSKKLHRDVAKILNKSSISKVYVYGNYIKETFNKIKTQKKGRILKNKMQLQNFINSDLKNNDYLLVKGSNATGLNNLISKIKIGKINAL